MCRDGSYYEKKLKCSHCSKEFYERTIEKINLNHKRDVLAKFYTMDMYTSSNPSYVKGRVIRCVYNPEEQHLHNNMSTFPTIRNSEKDYRNFIKPLSEKPETQGE